MIHAVPSTIVLKVVFQAIEDASKILGFRPVTERHQLEQNMKRQRGHWKRRSPFDWNANDVGHDMAEAGHVQDQAFFEFQPISRERFIERKDIHPTPVAVVQAMRAACAREAVVGKSTLQLLEILESRDDDGHVHIVGLAVRPNAQEKLGDKRPHDPERDPQLPQSALKVDDDPRQAGIKARHRREPWARAVRPPRAPARCLGTATRRRPAGPERQGACRRSHRPAPRDRAAQ